MSEKPHCFHMGNRWKMLKEQEFWSRRIKKFNEISRSFEGEILEIIFRQTGSNNHDGTARKALKMQGIIDDCTIEAGRCIQ